MDSVAWITHEQYRRAGRKSCEVHAVFPHDFQWFREFKCVIPVQGRKMPLEMLRSMFADSPSGLCLSPVSRLESRVRCSDAQLEESVDKPCYTTCERWRYEEYTARRDRWNLCRDEIAIPTQYGSVECVIFVRCSGRGHGQSSETAGWPFGPKRVRCRCGPWKDHVPTAPGVKAGTTVDSGPFFPIDDVRRKITLAKSATPRPRSSGCRGSPFTGKKPACAAASAKRVYAVAGSFDLALLSSGRDGDSESLIR